MPTLREPIRSAHPDAGGTNPIGVHAEQELGPPARSAACKRGSVVDPIERRLTNTRMGTASIRGPTARRLAHR